LIDLPLAKPVHDKPRNIAVSVALASRTPDAKPVMMPDEIGEGFEPYSLHGSEHDAPAGSSGDPAKIGGYE